MTQTISRIYGTPERAAKAETALLDAGFSAEQVRLVPYPGSATYGTNRLIPSMESLAQEIATGHILRAHARIYAEGVLRGGSLLTVHAPFGTAARAVAIINSFEPIASGVEDPDIRLPPWDEATPVSSALRIPVSLNMPSPFSVFWNVPVLLDKPLSCSAFFGLPLLFKQVAPLSASLGLPLLLSRFNLSNLLGLPVLVRSQRSRT